MPTSTMATAFTRDSSASTTRAAPASRVASNTGTLVFGSSQAIAATWFIGYAPANGARPFGASSTNAVPPSTTSAAADATTTWRHGRVSTQATPAASTGGTTMSV